MITKPTVFVLGAGVSMPYGFPSGMLLVEQICAATAGTNYEDDPTALIDKGQIHERLITKFGEEKTEKIRQSTFPFPKIICRFFSRASARIYGNRKVGNCTFYS